MFLMAAIAAMLQLPADAYGQPADSSDVHPPLNIRSYTDEQPLIFEGSWDLWPYTFLNDNGTASTW